MKKPLMIFFLIGTFLVGAVSFHTNVCSSDDSASFILPQYSKKISMDFKEASLQDVLKAFSQQMGVNFITSETVQSKSVTVFLENVPVEEALEMVLSANGLTYQYQADVNTILVKPEPKDAETLVTRIYQLKYATVTGAKMSSMMEGGSSSSLGSSGGGSTGSSGTGGSISEAVKGILTASGKMVEDTRTNSLIITDAQRNFGAIEKVIARLDVPVPEILIEVEMLEVSKNAVDNLGVQFGDTPFKFSGSSKWAFFPFNAANAFDKLTPSGDMFLTGAYDFSGLTAAVNFLKTLTDTKSLARPRIMTLDNQMAQIEISTDEVVGFTTTKSGTGGASQTDTTVTPERYKTGVFLRVTPQANLLTNEITLAVDPKVVEAKQGLSYGSQAFFNPEERGVKSILRVKNGETVIIGGLLRSSTQTITAKVPLLGDTPIIGALFRHKNTNDVQRELLIVLTPRIILSGGNMPKESSSVNLKDFHGTREQSLLNPKSAAVDAALEEFSR